MVTLQKSGKRKNHSNQVKITPKEWISFLGGAHRGTARNKRAVPLWAPPRSEIHSFGVIFTLFGAIFTHFGMIFTLFEGDFQSIRVIFMLSTLLKSNHFNLFTLREYTAGPRYWNGSVMANTGVPCPILVYLHGLEQANIILHLPISEQE